MKRWIFVLTYKHRGFLLSCGSESLAMHDQILSWSFISPRFTQSYQHIFYTDLCCSLAHWLFLTWLADIVMAWVLSQWLSPLPTFFWVIVERRRREERANTMTQSILQEFCSAHDFAEIRKGFPLLHSAIFSSFVGSLQAAILWPRNLQFYLHLCLIVQHCKYYLVHVTCLHDI